MNSPRTGAASQYRQPLASAFHHTQWVRNRHSLRHNLRHQWEAVIVQRGRGNLHPCAWQGRWLPAVHSVPERRLVLLRACTDSLAPAHVASRRRRWLVLSVRPARRNCHRKRRIYALARLRCRIGGRSSTTAWREPAVPYSSTDSSQEAENSLLAHPERTCPCRGRHSGRSLLA